MPTGTETDKNSNPSAKTLTVSFKDTDNPGMSMPEKRNVRGDSHCLQMSEELSVEEKIGLLEDIRRSGDWK